MLIYYLTSCVLIFHKIPALSANNQYCVLENGHGKCVSASLCPQTENALKRSCPSGTVCCRVSAKIVTPINTNTNVVSPVATQTASSTVAPQWVTVNPVVVNPTGTQSVGSGNVFPGGSTPAGSIPSSGGAIPSGSFPSSGGSIPSGSTPPSGSFPPSGSSPPSGNPPSGSPPPNGSSPPGGSPSNGGAPPGGSAPPSGSGGGGPPPLVGNIMVPPNMPPRNNPPTSTPSDTIVISAEVVDNSLDFLEQKCKNYNLMVSNNSKKSVVPIVMIIGGVDTGDKEFPHMAALGFGEANSKQWLCGGSLISENYVVTAAHCLSVASIGEVRYIKLGTNQLDKSTANTQEFNVIKRTPHPSYVTSGQYNDIALLQMDKSAQLTEYVMPICLFTSSNYEDRNLIATGWGKTETGSPSLHLQKVGLELFSQAECQKVYNVIPRDQLPLGIQETSQICAGSRTQKKDTCQGDSGGPLQIRKDSRWYLVGITSFGIQCGNIDVPGVYTRLSHYVPWIQQTVWNK